MRALARCPHFVARNQPRHAVLACVVTQVTPAPVIPAVPRSRRRLRRNVWHAAQRKRARTYLFVWPASLAPGKSFTICACTVRCGQGIAGHDSWRLPRPPAHLHWFLQPRLGHFFRQRNWRRYRYQSHSVYVRTSDPIRLSADAVARRYAEPAASVGWCGDSLLTRRFSFSSPRFLHE